ncbi:hypothetical protein [Pseudophaeobacter profundi]|uniref:hypothetical protein n=1 Tax=Pseudophaeobacter profundi TaxID=3034152 RepID=UPI002430D90C|nr:hypothetical protein [Pseudophaeobacter profundi]
MIDLNVFNTLAKVRLFASRNSTIFMHLGRVIYLSEQVKIRTKGANQRSQVFSGLTADRQF